jgi:hypothetical protein
MFTQQCSLGCLSVFFWVFCVYKGFLGERLFSRAVLSNAKRKPNRERTVTNDFAIFKISDCLTYGRVDNAESWLWN